MNSTKKLLNLLNTVDPLEVKAIELFRKRRQAGQVRPPLRGSKKREMVEAIIQMTRIKEQSALMLKRVETLKPVVAPTANNKNIFIY